MMNVSPACVWRVAVPLRASTAVTVANSPTALASSVLGLEARNRDPSSREPERNAVEIERRSIEMYLLTLRKFAAVQQIARQYSLI
jgi:hypothetical protein